MQMDIDQLVKQVEGKAELLKALANVKLDNSLYLKDDSRERGISYASSEKMLASVQGPFKKHGVHIQLIASDYKNPESDYQMITGSRGGDRAVKDAKVTCLFTATHLETGQTMIYAHSSAAVADNHTNMKDAVSKAVTTLIGTFIRGLVLVPKLSRQDLETTKQTVQAQHQIAKANKEISRLQASKQSA